MPSQSETRFSQIEDFLAAAAARGDHLVPEDTTILDSVRDKAGQVIAAGALTASLTSTLPAAAHEAPAPKPVVAGVDSHTSLPPQSPSSSQLHLDSQKVNVTIVRHGRERVVQVSAPGPDQELIVDKVTPEQPTISHNLAEHSGATLGAAVKSAREAGIVTTRMYVNDSFPLLINRTGNDTVTSQPQTSAQTTTTNSPVSTTPEIAQPAESAAAPVLPVPAEAPPVEGPPAPNDFRQPYPIDSAPPPPAAPAPEIVPPGVALVRSLNIEAIPQLGSMPAELAQEIMTHLIRDHGYSRQGAKIYTANIAQESGGNINVVGDEGKAKGLCQVSGGRQEGLPNDFHGQLDWCADVEMARDGKAADLPAMLRDPNATEEQLWNAFKRWLRWGKIGHRKQFAHAIERAISSPKGTQITAPSTPENNSAPEAPKQPPPTPAPAPTPPPAPAAPAAEPSIQQAVGSMVHAALAPVLEAAQEALNPKTGAEVEAELRAKYGNVSGKLRAEDLEALDGPWVGHRLHPVAAQSLKALNHEFYLRFGRSIGLTDSYRDYAEQVIVKRKKKDFAAAPGTSTHGWGLAIDIEGLDFGDEEYKWLMANAGRFGWENPEKLRDGQGIDEGWHWEKTG